MSDTDTIEEILKKHGVHTLALETELLYNKTQAITTSFEKGKEEGVEVGYTLAVKHLKEAFEHNANTTVPEAVEWLSDNVRLYSPKE